MRVGIDIIEIERIQAAVDRNSDFAERVLSPEEYILYQSYSPKRQLAFLAGRFCAKEAYAKALGTGIGHFLKFNQLSILPDPQGVPNLVAGPLIEGVSLSISHSRKDAIAVCIINQDAAIIQTSIEQMRK